MSFSYRHRKVLIIIFLIVLGSISSLFYLYSNKKIFQKEKVKVVKKKVMISKKEDKVDEKKEENYEVKVDVKGEVINPGLYTLNSDLRVEDAINAAGGLTYNASTDVINLSKKLKDEMVIIIYSKAEVADFVKTKKEENIKIDKCKEGVGDVENDACIDSSNTENNDSSSTNAIVNLNTATKEDLMTISGIGDAKADSIIKYREEHGSFTSIEQLKEISGIGDSIYDKIKDHFTI